MPYTHDTADSLYIEPLSSLALGRAGVLSLQFALKRAIETHFQIEPSELGVTSMGGDDTPNIFIYEAAEGSLGVLSRLVSDPKTFNQIVNLAIAICRFDDPSPHRASHLRRSAQLLQPAPPSRAKPMAY